MDEWRRLFQDMDQRVQNLQRVMVSTATGFPIKENLLPEALAVHPSETPVLNRLARLPGSGSAVEWKEITGFNKTGSVFYTEGAKPNAIETTYAPQSAGYKLMGRSFGVTGFARAVGMSFEDALVVERASAIVGMKEDIENAIVNADGTAGSFEGLITQIAAGNGSYVQDVAGALALDDIEDALRTAFDGGYQINYMLVNSLQAQQINALVLAAGTHAITVLRDQQSAMAAGGRVTHIVDPISGYPIELLPHRNLAAGTMLGIPERLPAPVAGRQGQRGLWWDVLQEITEMELGATGDLIEYYLKTYATMPFPGRRGAFKLTGIV